MIGKRIAFYTKKVAEYASIHVSKRKNPYRYKRLLLYKELMHEKIGE